MLLFPQSGPKNNFRVNGFNKTVTPHLRSIVPSVQQHNGTWPTSLIPLGPSISSSSLLPSPSFFYFLFLQEQLKDIIIKPIAPALLPPCPPPRLPYSQHTRALSDLKFFENLSRRGHGSVRMLSIRASFQGPFPCPSPSRTGRRVRPSGVRADNTSRLGKACLPCLCRFHPWF